MPPNEGTREGRPPVSPGPIAVDWPRMGVLPFDRGMRAERMQNTGVSCLRRAGPGATCLRAESSNADA
jgi:hypothetical protein